MNSERARIIRRFKRLRAEIRQQFIDAESWNDHSEARKNGAAPVDPDPFGEMKRLVAALDELLANDPGEGPIAKLNFTRSH